jgi:Leucine-rich repeat (LRR) protein
MKHSIYMLAFTGLVASTSILKLKHMNYNDEEMANRLENIPNAEGIFTLDLSYNKLTRVPDLSRFTSLDKLYLDNNQIESLEFESFFGLDELEELYIRNNLISIIHPETFDIPYKLAFLSLDGNLIERLPGSVFRSLNGLSLLSLSNNDLSRSDYGCLYGLDSLEFLSIHSTKLTPVQYMIFDHLPSSTVIMLQAGSLTDNQSLLQPSEYSIVSWVNLCIIVVPLIIYSYIPLLRKYMASS